MLTFVGHVFDVVTIIGVDKVCFFSGMRSGVFLVHPLKSDKVLETCLASSLTTARLMKTQVNTDKKYPIFIVITASILSRTLVRDKTEQHLESDTIVNQVWGMAL